MNNNITNIITRDFDNRLLQTNNPSQTLINNVIPMMPLIINTC